MNRFSWAIFAAIALSAPFAQAATSWSFSSGSNCSDASVGGAGSCAWGNTRSVSSGGVTATAQAWSNTKGSGTTQLETGYLAVYSGGLGVKNRDGAAGASPADSDEYGNPEHSVDSNQRFDSVLFSFSQAITLSSVTLGWTNIDSDMTIMAYTGVGAPVLDGKSFANLSVANGWQAIGSYADVGQNTKSVNASNISSSYWLIGAYNPNLIDAGWSAGNDYFKILQLAGTPTPPRDQQVPEPPAAWLIGAALAGLVVRNRMRT